MNGIVTGSNKRRTRYAIQTEQGITIADLEYGELAIGDQVSGTLDEHGDAKLRNITSGDMVEVNIAAFYATPQSAAHFLAQ